ncbi:hypothetical protein [[Clostridium] fimetarium]|uniref:Uncharacterized protein n=1 Tax=[Clostridium] fimetarium TaxID=99656 RepID=A0A1I0PZJ1_9FIRM|nr:hypothetical protein [[Clostridium] fimetarium]SEW19985.1 hypothetical protein SAMN05421659_106164 [[Clostridium] fimetarium]
MSVKVNKKMNNITSNYSYYISEIDHIMHNLEKGRTYEKTGCRQDGYLATNISKLRKEINEMMYYIQKDELGIEEPSKKVLRTYEERENKE